jgi:hypothetical protein
MDTIFYILVGVALYILVRKYVHFSVVVKETEQAARARLNEIIHVVKQEKDGDMYYWYDQDNHQFIAQGRTLEEIIGVLKARWNQHIFVISEKEMMVGPDFEIYEVDFSRNV